MKLIYEIEELTEERVERSFFQFTVGRYKVMK